MPRNKLRRKKSKSKTRAPVFSRKMFRNLEQLSGTRALVFNPPGETKMSEVLLDFAKPLLELVDDRHSDKVIALAIACWNATLLPEEVQEASINELIDIFSSSGIRNVEMAKEAVQILLERKRRYLPDNKRFIADYRISHSKDQMRLTVASTLSFSDEE